MLAVVLGLGLPAAAAPVRGTVRFSEEVKGAGRHPGYWRVPNGMLPLAPVTRDVRTEAVVVLYPQGTVTGAQVAAAAAQEQAGKPRADIKIAGLRLYPTVVVVPPGATVNFRNDDLVEHAFSISCIGPVGQLPRLAVPPGKEAALTIDKPGDCILHSQDYTHLTGAVLAVERGFYGRVNADGEFQFDAPEGHYQARLFFRGTWLLTQPVDVLADGADLALTTVAPPPRPAKKPAAARAASPPAAPGRTK